jgi:hypothetical protein
LIETTRDAVMDSWANLRFKGIPNRLSVFVFPSIGMFDLNWDTLERAYDSVGLDVIDTYSWNEVLMDYPTTMKQHGPWTPGALK